MMTIALYGKILNADLLRTSGVRLFLILFILSIGSVSAFAVDRTWDGGGATENWTEPANWSGDTAPGASDVAIFNGTSTKNASIDAAFSIQALQINAGYTGTISQGVSNLTLSGAFSQATGTFTTGAGQLNFNSTFTLSGGTFNAPAGSLTLSSTITIGNAAVFNPNGGTVVFGGSTQFLTLPASLTLNNLTVAKSAGQSTFFQTTSTIVVTGTLTLTEGAVNNNSGIGTIDARGDVSIAPTYDGGTTNHLISGTATRTVTLPVGAVIPVLTVNAPNVTLNASGTGTITFAQPLSIQSVASFTNGSVNFVFNNPFTFEPTSNFTPGSGNLTFNGSFTQTGGTFTPGGGQLNFNSTFTLSGGTFNAPAGSLTLSSTITIGNAAVFNPNGGTVVFGGSTQFLTLPASLTLNNLTVAKSAGQSTFFETTSTIVVTGTLTLTEGAVNNSGGTGTIDAQGNVSIAATYDGGNTAMRFSGAANQTYSNAGGVNQSGSWTFDKSAGTVNLASDLDLSNGTGSIQLTNGTMTTATNTVNAGSRNITRTNGYVNGNLQRRFTTTGARTFDVGSANGYSPVGVNITTLTVNPSELRIGAVQDAHPNAPITGSRINRFWTLTETGNLTAVLTFNYLEDDLPLVDESTFALQRYTGVGSVFDLIPATLDTTANTATTTSGITDFSDWTLLSLAPTAADAVVAGRVLSADGRGVPRANLTISGDNGVLYSATTNPFGYFRFPGVPTGSTYIVTVRHKTFSFANPTQFIAVFDDVTDLNFTATESLTSGAAGVIAGRVLDGDLGIHDAEIEVTGGELEKPIVVLTDKAGRFEVDGLKFGQSYFVSVRKSVLVFADPIRMVTVTEEPVPLDFKALSLDNFLSRNTVARVSTNE